ncbi:MAG: SH3 domain-containing protein, partial [Ardenticatenia bacterium]|nr:SH3 domain-containing protein [Ardenticatenia bacterium]
MYRTVLSVLIVCLALTACGGKATPDPAVVAQAVAATLTAQASAVTLIAEAPTVIATPTDAPSSTAMLTATLIPLPTVTPTPTDTPLPPMPTATPAATPSLTPEVPIAVVQSQALNVRAGPGTEHPVVASAERGETLTVVGRNEDASWLEVMLPEGQRGWAAGWLVGV